MNSGLYWIFLCVTLTHSIQSSYALTPEQEQIHDIVTAHVLNQANIPISFRMQNPVIPFIGRELEISELRWAHVDRKLVILTGPRGIGKSEIARKYAQEIKLDNTSSTLWIDSETHTSFIDSFKHLALSIGNKLENKDATSIIRDVFEHFKNRKTLFIFDHSKSDNILVNNIPVWIGKSKLISVLVTSRDEDWDTVKFKTIQIKPFTVEESIKFIKEAITKEISIPLDDANCTKLAETLHFIPLALTGAVKDIIKQNSLNPNKVYTINDFIVSFNEEPVKNITITEVRGPTAEELEDAVSNKIKEEVHRVGDQITDEAKRVSESVRNEARRFRKRLHKWFG